MSPPRLVFFAGGECLLRHGTWVRRTSPSEDGTFEDVTRSGAVGPYIDRDGVLRNAEADVLRPHWLDLDGDGKRETPAMLSMIQQANLNSGDNPSTWIGGSAPVGTSVSDPAGGTDAYTIADDSGVAALSRYFTPSLTGDGTKGLSFAVRERDHSTDGTGLLVRDQTAGTQRLHLQIEAWTDGEPTTITDVAGTYIGKRRLYDDWWQIFAQAASVIAANENRVLIYPAYEFGGGGDASLTGSIDVYRVNVFDEEWPYQSILNASENPGNELIEVPVNFPVRRITIYVKMAEWGAGLLSDLNGEVIHIGGIAGADPRFRIHSPSGSDGLYQALFDNGTAVASATIGSGASSYDDLVELRAVLDYNEDDAGDVLIGQTVAEGAEVTATGSGPSGGIARPYVPWSNNRMLIGLFANGAWNAFAAVKVALGHHSRDAMRAA